MPKQGDRAACCDDGGIIEYRNESSRITDSIGPCWCLREGKDHYYAIYHCPWCGATLANVKARDD